MDDLHVTESDAVDVVETAIKHHTSDVTTKAMALISLLKIIKDLISFPFLFRPMLLTDGFVVFACRRVKSIIGQNKGSFVLELQQRSMEFSSV
ncbi:hypothetical protein YC2023_004820 [Brassica napus]